MTTREMESAINALCISGHFETLHQIIKDIPGSKAILISDRTAEQKRRELLRLLKKKAPIFAEIGAQGNYEIDQNF